MVQAEKKTKKSFGEKAAANCRGFLHFLYNKEKGEVMGRNGRSWAKIGIFYVVYYGCLAGFFAAMLAVFLQTLNQPGKGGPKLTQYLDKGPGLRVLKDITGYDPKDNSSYDGYVKAMNDYLKSFESKDYATTDCPLSTEGYKGQTPCRFNTSLLEKCSGKVDKSFGFANSTPCQFVLINKVFNWIPNNYASPFLALKCSLKSGDGKVEVFPDGFQISAFPFRGQSFYKTPPVAVKVEHQGTVKVRCKLSGKGIKSSDFYDKSRSFGNVEFTVKK